MSTVCPFRDLFGAPRTGAHSIRIPILDIALVDTVLTFIAAWLLQRVFFRETPYLTVLLILAILGEILHVVFCVKTPVTEWLA
jgi:hypothetical protein